MTLGITGEIPDSPAALVRIVIEAKKSILCWIFKERWIASKTPTYLSRCCSLKLAAG
jgi:hypothetical protein